MDRHFMFTDIVGSSRLWSVHSDEMPDILREHDRVLGESVNSHNGSLIKHTGDGIFASFTDPFDCIRCSLDMLQGINTVEEASGVALSIRVGIHAGSALERDGDLFGPDINLTARVMNAAVGGQILATARAVENGLPRGVRLRDLGFHVLKDVHEPVRLYSIIHPDLKERYSSSRRVLSVPGNLPREQSPFVGREREILQISSMMRSEDCRLLTLTGPGGTGKTRLSIRIANELSHRYSDGAFFVPLAELDQKESIASKIALTIGFTPDGDGALEDQLAEHLSRCEMLLVLDNFEHLTDQAEIPGSLLERTDRLNILVTSRHRLRLRAEWVFEVPGMSLSESGGTDGDSDGVELFARTAKRIYGVDIADGDRIKVEGICRTIEGSPLAIELAASMCGILSLSEIAEQVLDPLSMESVMRDHPDRHSSLEAVFFFSWNLLDPSQKSALCLLTVFKGGFDRRAAESVCGIKIPVLLALRDRSLIWQLQEGYFGIHGTIKYFAGKRTDVMEDPEAVRSAHSEHYLHLLASRENDLVRGDRIGALADLERDLENIRAAWTFAVRTGRTDLLRGCLRGFVMLMAVKGQFREVYGILEETIEVLGEKDDEALLMAELLGHLGWAGSHVLPLDRCIPPLERSLELYRSSGDAKGLAYGLNNFANVLNVKGEDERAESLYNESLEISRSIGDLLGMSAPINNLGILAERRSDLDRAEELYRESAEICGRLGNQHGESMSLTNLSTVIRDKGDLRGSMELLNRALAIQQSIGDDFNTSLIYCYMAEILIAGGNLEEAEEILHRILSCLDSQGHVWWVAWVQLLLTVTALERGDPDSARASFSRAVELFDAHRWSQHLLEMMAVSAIFLSEFGRPDEAIEIASAAIQGGMISSYLKGKVQRVLGESGSTVHGTEKVSVDVDSLITLLRSTISGKSP